MSRSSRESASLSLDALELGFVLEPTGGGLRVWRLPLGPTSEVWITDGYGDLPSRWAEVEVWRYDPSGVSVEICLGAPRTREALALLVESERARLDP